MDFDDLLVLWQRLMQEHPDLCDHYQRRFQFVLVDEYQDTNTIQADLVDLLAARHQNVMAVGDDSQSIYSWRGANFQNILQFPKRYPNAKIYKIETNYRSTPEILQVANAAIQPNVHQFTKELAPARRSGLKPILVPCPDAATQSAFVAQRILELREEGVELQNMAVLYRAHFHCLELQMELTRRNIPFSVTSGIRFFEQAHIKDVTAYLKLLANPGDELAFKRLVQMLPGIGGKGAEKLWQAFQGACAAKPAETRAAALQSCAKSVPKKATLPWANFAITVSQLEAPEARDHPSEMITLVLKAGYEDHLKELYTNYQTRREDLEQLATFARGFSGTDEFLTQLALLSNLEAEDDVPANRDSERIRLSTIHQAKGLEFDAVFVIMLCDGLFPSKRSLEFSDGEEEERRLFYVAITRARNELHLSYPLMRSMPGRGGELMQVPSRFLREIPKDLIEELHLRLSHFC
jgi:DNA helicase-2/ATP-dependent DNA helicase PcrA